MCRSITIPATPCCSAGRSASEWRVPHWRAGAVLSIAPANIISFVALPACGAGYWMKSESKKVNKVKTARITHCTFRIANFFTRSYTYGIRSQAFATSTSANVTAQKRPNRAGATPLFGGRSAQKFGRVAPALAGTSRQRVLRGRVGSPRICQTACLTFCTNKKGEASCPF